MLNKYRDVITGSVLMAWGVVLFIATFSIKAMVAKVRIGPEFMPRIASVLLFILGALILMDGIKKLSTRVIPTYTAEQAALRREGAIKVILSLALLIAYVALMYYFGFIICTVAYIFGQTVILAPKSKRTKKDTIAFAIIAVVTSIVVYCLFVYGLTLLLPTGRVFTGV